MKIQKLSDLLSHELQDLMSAESQLVKALPKLIKKCSSDELRSVLEEHLNVTVDQVERLQNVFEKLSIRSKREKCRAMEGLLEEGENLLGLLDEPSARDAGIITAAQRVEHYEIAGYGCARTFAKLLGEMEVSDLLQQTLDEEKQADKRLTELAMSTVNPRAVEQEESGVGYESMGERTRHVSSMGRRSPLSLGSRSSGRRPATRSNGRRGRASRLDSSRRTR